MGSIRDIYHRLLLVPSLSACFRPARPNCATIFMLHRLADPDRDIHGLDPEVLRRALSYLRKNGYELLDLSTLFCRLSSKEPSLRSTVVFTLDDGYIDQAEVAGPVFAEFDCPATIFTTTGFIDGKLWMWWDKIEYIFSETKRQSLEVTTCETTTRYSWSSKTEMFAARTQFINLCKALVDQERYKAIADLAVNADVELPLVPPPRFAPISWDVARTWEKSGLNFGPHTVTHPILSLIEAEQASHEITESWRRLCEEVDHPTPVFCYPNGQASDFGIRETGIIKAAGLSGAVTGIPGFADKRSFSSSADATCRIGRLSFPESLSDLVQYVCGIERYKQILRKSL